MIDFFAGDPEAIVEPWAPKVGDRVRVNIGECLSLDWLHDWGKRDQGREGQVEQIRKPGWYLNHRFLVRFADTEAASFAACELEPLYDAAPWRESDDGA